MRSLFLFYKQIHSFNIPFSLAIAALAYSQGGSFDIYFFLTVLTLGYMLSLYFFEVWYSNQYFFYYNLGLGKVKLFSFCFGINAVIALLYFLLF
tara:strand:- start:316734 stop:317015 length:282 start_codon:yes stop_codon:yes gene_type:complete